MAFDLQAIRTAAQRVAASHGLDVVDVEFSGGSRHRMLRIFIEKDEAGRAQLARQAEELRAGGAATGENADLPEALLSGTFNQAQLSGVTHEDCEVFSRDFGTLIDVEDLVPGAEYTLEVSSPGLDRRIAKPEEFLRFSGSLVKLQTFTPVNGNRHWQGRLLSADGGRITLDLAAVKGRKKRKKGDPVPAENDRVELELSNIEKANVLPEI